MDHAIHGFAEPVLAGEAGASRGADSSGARHGASPDSCSAGAKTADEQRTYEIKIPPGDYMPGGYWLATNDYAARVPKTVAPGSIRSQNRLVFTGLVSAEFSQIEDENTRGYNGFLSSQIMIFGTFESNATLP